MPIAQTWEERNIEKACKGCDRRLPVSAYSFKNQEINLRQAHCRQCVSSRSKAGRPEALIRERAWALANPLKAKLKHHREGLRKNYGLTPADYNEMLKKQNGKCAICGVDSPGRKNGTNFYVDHCHATGLVRGLLCHSCNLGIGHLKDDVRLVESALQYLRKSIS